ERPASQCKTPPPRQGTRRDGAGDHSSCQTSRGCYACRMPSTYLVTGASRGLGAEFVKQLCGRDHRLLAAMRDPTQGEAARRAGATGVRLDVDRPETFDAFAASLDRPVDVLVNNAGIADT